MPIKWPPSLDALGLVPFQLNPHYFAAQVYTRQGGQFQEHFGETRDDRIHEFHGLNHAPVIGLWGGSCLRIDDRSMLLVGAGARLFLRDAEPVDLEPGSRIHVLIRGDRRPRPGQC